MFGLIPIDVSVFSLYDPVGRDLQVTNANTERPCQITPGSLFHINSVLEMDIPTTYQYHTKAPIRIYKNQRYWDILHPLVSSGIDLLLSCKAKNKEILENCDGQIIALGLLR